MSAGIMEFDIGYVGGVANVWHGLPQYTCYADRMIRIDEAVKVASYGIEKQPLYRGAGIEVGAYALVRTDKDVTLVPSVGERFVVEDNRRMVNVVSESLLAIYPELVIESVGTLWNGATFFMNLKVSEFTIKGDKSPTVTNLMYANPLGKGSYVACAHSTRVVCANTARIAEAQGVANKSIKKFRHTANASQKIDSHLIDLAELKLELKRHETLLNFMSESEITVAQVDAYLEQIFPASKDEGRARTIATNSRDEVKNIFEGIQVQTLSKPFTKYGLFQAYTDWCDHEKTSRNADTASVTFDGLMGIRADKKQQVLELLAA